MAKTKARKVMDLLNNTPSLTDKQVAAKVGCHPSYVCTIRKKMVHVPPCPETDVLELTKEMEVRVGAMYRPVEGGPAKVMRGERANAIQEGGDHYKRMGVEPWDVFDTWPAEQRIGAYRANCVKYVLRLEDKDSRVLNAKKLKHYAQKLVEVAEELEAKGM